MKKNILLLFFTLLIFSACIPKERAYFQKKLTFPDKITAEQKIKLAAYVVPTPQQYAWQELELTAFIHFGINTFTGREWGDGTENPELFNPSDFNAEQWVTSLHESGFKMLILTAKHHDGFCLWPTKTTAYSVAAAPWRNGQGDVVREVKNACDKYGMKFGVYLSPWDRNAPSYGDSPAYNAMFVQQLTELLTQYGEIHEVWFDGANGEGPNGKRQEYDWKRFYQVIDSLQPNAVKAIMGNDVRWVGNEKGLGRETEWSVTPLNPDINESITTENKRLNIEPTAKDLGSRKLIEKANTLYWYPSEVDVSIRPGWFYHPEQDHQVKTLQELVDIYYQSVGMNSVLLLNIPPDTRGLLHEIDVERLKQFGDYITSTFKTNLLSGGEIAWRGKQGDYKELTVQKGATVNTLMLQEDILKGQRVEVFKVEALLNNTWEKIAEGTTIGYKRLVKFNDCQPEKIRITILETRERANIRKIGAYYAPLIEDSVQAIKLNDISSENWKLVKKHPLTIDLGEPHTLKGFTYNPIAGKESVFNYVFRVSNDGKKWETLKDGEFSNIKNNPIAQFVRLQTAIETRYIQLETINGTEGGKPSIEISQVGILKN